jgi:hypothetical protein
MATRLRHNGTRKETAATATAATGAGYVGIRVTMTLR